MASKVYFTREITPQSLIKIYEALGWTPKGKCAVKISTGEIFNPNSLQPELIYPLVKKVGGKLVENNTAYEGARQFDVTHKMMIQKHGYNRAGGVDLLDSKGEIEIPVTNGKHLKADLVGAGIQNYQSCILLSHFKGHPMAGYGGAIKNGSIGFASPHGKARIHSASKTDFRFTGWLGDGKFILPGGDKNFQESMVEATSAVFDYFGRENVICINVMNNLSVDCDCFPFPAAPKMSDYGIFASADPVACDQACLDVIWAQKDAGGADLVKRITNRGGLRQTEYGAEFGLGTKDYEVIDLDK